MKPLKVMSMRARWPRLSYRSRQMHTQPSCPCLRGSCTVRFQESVACIATSVTSRSSPFLLLTHVPSASFHWCSWGNQTIHHVLDQVELANLPREHGQVATGRGAVVVSGVHPRCVRTREKLVSTGLLSSGREKTRDQKRGTREGNSLVSHLLRM